MKNRIHNSQNPYQGGARKVLCVCSAGLLRSPTLAVVLQREFGFNTRAVGNEHSHALVPLDEALVAWADEIIVMDVFQGESVLTLQENMVDYNDSPVYVLEVPDNYEYMDEELQSILLQEYKRVISGEIRPYV